MLLICVFFRDDHLGLDIRKFVPEESWFSLSHQQLITCSSSSRGGILQNFLHPHWYLDCCGHYGSLVLVITLLRLRGCNSTIFLKDTIWQQILWFLECSYPSLLCFQTLYVRCIVSAGASQAPHGHIFSAFWSVLDHCNSLYLLQQETSLVRNENYTYKDKYLEYS